jgi:hypothetical protein
MAHFLTTSLCTLPGHVVGFLDSCSLHIYSYLCRHPCEERRTLLGIFGALLCFFGGTLSYHFFGA